MLKHLCASCVVPFILIIIHECEAGLSLEKAFDEHLLVGTTLFCIGMISGIYFNKVQQKEQESCLLNKAEIGGFIYDLTESVSAKVERYQTILGKEISSFP